MNNKAILLPYYLLVLSTTGFALHCTASIIYQGDTSIITRGFNSKNVHLIIMLVTSRALASVLVSVAKSLNDCPHKPRKEPVNERYSCS